MERRGAAREQVEYVLTRKGLELKPVIIALTEWGDKWVRPGPITFRDRAGNAPVELQLRRAAGGQKRDVADVVAVPR
jgi:hypothetical protein